mmetsp:Transcript_22961/g.48522  ORF Transcript_22961/g.48522 Transcript_22961/m.48522 type:complete len:218 (-) Transcript_22961:172-825(-)
MLHPPFSTPSLILFNIPTQQLIYKLKQLMPSTTNSSAFMVTQSIVTSALTSMPILTMTVCGTLCGFTSSLTIIPFSVLRSQNLAGTSLKPSPMNSKVCVIENGTPNEHSFSRSWSSENPIVNSPLKRLNTAFDSDLINGKKATSSHSHRTPSMKPSTSPIPTLPPLTWTTKFKSSIHSSTMANFVKPFASSPTIMMKTSFSNQAPSTPKPVNLSSTF